jgi:alpha-D-xyloside xylohydrolase
MSIPLFAREGSIVAVGACDTDAVYDYADGVTYKVFALGDGKEAQTVVYSTENEVESQIRVSRSGNTYSICIDSEKPCKVELVHAGTVASVEGASYEQQEDSIVLTCDGAEKEIKVTV